MTQINNTQDGEVCNLTMKILYTLHGVESLKYIVKPANKVKSRVFRGIDLAILEIQPCLDAIREASPEFAGICDTHADDYAVYSVDFGENDLPLQCHGRVAQSSLIEATGKLCSSKIQGEHIEVHIHILPIRKPGEILAKAEEEMNNLSDMVHGEMLQSDGTDFSEHQLQMQQMFPFLPILPPPVQIPPSLLRNDNNNNALPSSPPVRARPNRIAQANKGGKRNSSNDALPAKKRRSTNSPNSDASSNLQCRNCGVEAASTWRRVDLPEAKGQLLCNACALYYKSKRVMRPSELWEKRTRHDDRTGLIVPASRRTSSLRGYTYQQRIPRQHQIPLQQLQQLQAFMQPQYYPVAATPHDSMELWSQETNSFLKSDDTDLSDRLVDNPLKQLDRHPTPFANTPPIEPKINNDIDETMKTTLNVPSTPKSKQVPSAPDTIQKLFNFSTPEQKSTLFLPGSGSTGKWLRKVMNSAEFEEFLRSPSVREGQTVPDLSLFTSSPPTSSNLFSEGGEWEMPGSPVKKKQREVHIQPSTETQK